MNSGSSVLPRSERNWLTSVSARTVLPAISCTFRRNAGSSRLKTQPTIPWSALTRSMRPRMEDWGARCTPSARGEVTRFAPDPRADGDGCPFRGWASGCPAGDGSEAIAGSTAAAGSSASTTAASTSGEASGLAGPCSVSAGAGGLSAGAGDLSASTSPCGASSGGPDVLRLEERFDGARRPFGAMEALIGGTAAVVASSPLSGSDRSDSFSSVVARVMRLAHSSKLGIPAIRTSMKARSLEQNSDPSSHPRTRKYPFTEKGVRQLSKRAAN
ncbi:hypothetical protein CHELA40_10487 [Chelatococcus asaccharovorans]|nr:hypothetical protein CHELA40_10487 [Chelatococcus asaccharovorans]CAH1686642.1 hypothetical protein CHELA17_65119 [Chelatococcus asaccharovorans]